MKVHRLAAAVAAVIVFDRLTFHTTIYHILNLAYTILYIRVIYYLVKYYIYIYMIQLQCKLIRNI